jgi:hypothetical protein
MATEQERSNSRGRLDFTPIDFDANNIEPDASEGTYEATVDDARIQATSKDNFPMLVVDWKLDSTETDTEAADKSVGATVADFFAFFPDGDKRGNFPKRRFKQLRELLDIPDDVLPTRLESKRDFDDLIAEIKGKSAKIYITLRVDKQTNEERTSVSYTAPRGSMGAMASENDDEPEEERRPAARRPAAPARKPASKPSRRR